MYLLRLLPRYFILVCLGAFCPAIGAVPALRLNANRSHELRMALRKIYTAELGIRELSGNNDGKAVEAYLSYVGLGKGNSWCAAFVCWALGKAGISNPRSGWSPALFPDSKIIWRQRRMLNVPAVRGGKVQLMAAMFLESSSLRKKGLRIVVLLIAGVINGQLP